METKYVVGFGRTGYVFQVFAVIFPEHATHSDIAIAIFGDEDYVLGAGFVSVQDDGVSVYGRSDSLGIKARVEDNKYIAAALCLGSEVEYAQRMEDEERFRNPTKKVS